MPYIKNADAGWFGFKDKFEISNFMKSLDAAHKASDSEALSQLRLPNPGLFSFAWRFLYELVGFSQSKFALLCVVMYLIFSNNLTYQLAIYVYVIQCRPNRQIVKFFPNSP